MQHPGHQNTTEYEDPNEVPERKIKYLEEHRPERAMVKARDSFVYSPFVPLDDFIEAALEIDQLREKQESYQDALDLIDVLRDEREKAEKDVARLNYVISKISYRPGIDGDVLWDMGDLSELIEAHHGDIRAAMDSALSESQQ